MVRALGRGACFVVAARLSLTEIWASGARADPFHLRMSCAAFQEYR